jgi:hypothetical protein
MPTDKPSIPATAEAINMFTGVGGSMIVENNVSAAAKPNCARAKVLSNGLFTAHPSSLIVVTNFTKTNTANPDF